MPVPIEVQRSFEVSLAERLSDLGFKRRGPKWLQRETDFGFEALELNYYGSDVLCFLVVRIDEVEELLEQAVPSNLPAREVARFHTLRWGLLMPWNTWRLDRPRSATTTAVEEIEARVREFGVPFFRDHHTLAAAFEFLSDEEQGSYSAVFPLGRCCKLVALSFLMNDRRIADDVVEDCRDYLHRHPQTNEYHIGQLEELAAALGQQPKS